MSEKYDGWCLKCIDARKPYFLTPFFARLRRDVVDLIEERVYEGYEQWWKDKGRGHYKIVKVKLVEVE